MRLRPSSLRGRLAALFALGSASLLLLASAFLYIDLRRELDTAVNQGLRNRANDLAGEIASGEPRLLKSDPFAQLLSPAADVLDATGAAPSQPVLTPAQATAAARRQLVVDGDVPGLGDDSRLLAIPVPHAGPASVLVVGLSRRPLIRGQRRLAVALAVLSPVLVGVLAAGGWLVASAALRPVLRMTEEADRISLAEPGRRLHEVPGDDEIAHLSRTLNTMLDRIEESFAHEQAFVDDASHELRTPVSILRAELELALVELDDPAELEQSLRSALEEAERLGHLADDLLVLARESAGRLPIRLERIDVDALARRVSSRLEGAAGPRVEVVGSPAPVEADAARLEQLLVNLVTNARRHARARVVVTLGDTPPSLTVADDGAGFPPELLPTAFDRFTRGDARRGRDAGGAGLGLSIVAAIARAHGWSIEAGNGGTLGGAWVQVVFSSRAR